MIRHWILFSLEQAQKGVLLDLKDKSVLYAKGAYDKVYPASITKIITALLAFKNSNMDDVVTITQENITLEEGSQVVGFQVGDQVTMDQLVHCLWFIPEMMRHPRLRLMWVALQKLVAMMNEYAAQLGCTGTQFYKSTWSAGRKSLYNTVRYLSHVERSIEISGIHGNYTASELYSYIPAQ